MVKIRNGKLFASNVAFALPEGFNLTLEPTGCGVHLLEFSSENEAIKDAKIYIDIEFVNEEIFAEEVLKEIIEDCEMENDGNPFYVTRGKGTAIAAYYHSSGFVDHYEERYDFSLNELNQNGVSIGIYLMANHQKKLKQSIREALKLPNVKAFLDSVEYY